MNHFADTFFYLKIRWKPLFYIVNLIIPCVGIFYLSILVFYLPAQSGEKTALAIAILVSQTLYFTLVIEVIPATSLTLPLLGRYLLFSMVLVAVSVCLATIVLNLHYRKPSTHRMPNWVRNILIQKMPGILLTRVPKQVISINILIHLSVLSSTLNRWAVTVSFCRVLLPHAYSLFNSKPGCFSDWLRSIVFNNPLFWRNNSQENVIIISIANFRL